jgi:Protein of unknown function (DUF3768)
VYGAPHRLQEKNFAQIVAFLGRAWSAAKGRRACCFAQKRQTIFLVFFLQPPRAPRRFPQASRLQSEACSLPSRRNFIMTNTTTADAIGNATAQIRKANDAFRRGFPANGKRYITDGILGLSSEDRAAILDKVRTFDAFTEENDPHGEHDFGCIEHAGQRIFWKIDCYDSGSLVGSREPIDSTKVTRVLTIMLADEY